MAVSNPSAFLVSRHQRFLLSLGPVSVPDWAVVVFVAVMLILAIFLSVKRMRVEARLARTLWHALTRKQRN